MLFDLKDWLAFGFSAISLLISLTYLLDARRRDKRDRYAFESSYFSGICSWANEAVSTVSESIMLCDFDPKITGSAWFFERSMTLLAKIWGLVDRGRFFFPNYEILGFGEEKPLASRGYRHEILDELVNTYRALERVMYATSEGSTQPPDGTNIKIANGVIREEIKFYQKKFLSLILELLDPKRRSEEARLLMGGRSGAR